MNSDLTQKDKIEIQNLIYSEIKSLNALKKFNKRESTKQITNSRLEYFKGLLKRV